MRRISSGDWAGTGLDDGQSLGAERALLRLPGGHLHGHQGHAGHADVGQSTAAVDDGCGGEDFGAEGVEEVDDFFGTAAGGDNVFDDDATLAGLDGKATAQGHFAVGVSFGENAPRSQGAGHLMADHQAAHGGGDDGGGLGCAGPGIGRPISGQVEFPGDGLAERFGVSRMLQDEGALEVFGAMQAAGKSKVAFEIGTSFGKKSKSGVHVSMLAQPNGCSGSLSLEAGMQLEMPGCCYDG